MKSITVTSQNASNYGAVLQAYALHKQLLKLHVDDELLDLSSWSPGFFLKFNFDSSFKSVTYNNLVLLFYIIPTILKIRKFKKFIKDNIKTTRQFDSADEIKKNPPEADVYITGSDQMFNIHKDKDICFLRFGDDSIKRVSYATSMGGKTVADEHNEFFISAIRKYEHLSVREDSLKVYINGLCDEKCEVNIDPSFLLSKDEWINLTLSNPIKEKYILCYILLYHPLINRAIVKLHSLTGLKVVVLSADARNQIRGGDKVIRNAGPKDFLTLFRNAEYVLTTSFHGTCFSIIFEKKYYAFIRQDTETRITNLAKKVNLEDRIVTDLSQISCDDVDFTYAREIITKENNKGVIYLKKALDLV